MGSTRWLFPQSFVIAWQFLTAVPLSRTYHEPTAQELASSMAWYSLVGFMIGGGLVGVDLLLDSVFKPPIVNAMMLVVLIGLTRGLHQDGLADTVDGLIGGHDREARLRIMKDPAIGAIGATALGLSLIVRYAGFMALPHEVRVPALVTMPAVGRWSMVLLARLSPPARPDGSLASFLTYVSWGPVVIATGTLLVGLSIGFGVVGACLVLVPGTVLVLMARQWFHRRIGGVTGDTLGATNELAEILFLLLVPLLQRLP
ncbi:MAG: adenosylcobinamide-GDP ribazoletransferase [Nitrospira sp.]|nr:adenosylcobinamide-GDP ribazoletransferase [Nitrospira sp.]